MAAGIKLIPDAELTTKGVRQIANVEDSTYYHNIRRLLSQPNFTPVPLAQHKKGVRLITCSQRISMS
jgi:hypothetical protein